MQMDMDKINEERLIGNEHEVGIQKKYTRLERREREGRY